MALPLGFDLAQHFVDLSTSVLVRQVPMSKIGFKPVSTLNGRVDKPRAVRTQRLEEGARVPAILGASALVAGIERAVAPVRSEVRPIPEWHHAEHVCSDAHLAGRPVPLQQMQFLETFKNPEGEIDIDAERIKNLALKLVRQSFALQQMVVLGAPARSLQVGYGSAADHRARSQSPVSDLPAL